MIPAVTNPSSPNCDSRDGSAVSMLVLHYTGMRDAAAALTRLQDPASKVSAHYVIEENGGVIRLVSEDMRAWHAGASYWRGARNINQISIGIEIVNPGHEWGYRAFPDAQMRSVIALCRDILSRHAIPARNVVGHSDIAPARKEDPGELFDWAWLAREGIGLWPKKVESGEWRVESGKKFRHSPLATHHPQAQLASYGYDTADPPAAITAFQRHFRPKNLSGEWDSECQMLLDALLKMV